jgi:serine/alanine adding enzyme
MRVVICKNPTFWDAYVDAAPDASNYHRWVWKEVIEKTYGHEGYYLAAFDNGAIAGVLPLVLMKSRIFGRSLVSVPFFSYGGVLASTVQVQEELLVKAVELGRELGVRHIELRQGGTCDADAHWRDLTPKVTMEVRLPAKVDELWNRLSATLRKRIRYARKHGLRSQWGGSEAIGSFYQVFCTNMRNLGTPVYPRKWFENIQRHLPAGIRILTLLDEGRPVAGAFLTVFRDTLELPWAASVPDSREKFSPLLLYWSLLEYALEQGYRVVDLGRCTPGSGNYDFKRRWTPEEKPLHWYYWLAPGVPVPELRPDNPRFRLATTVWKRLPLFVANWLGPRVVRSLP